MRIDRNMFFEYLIERLAETHSTNTVKFNGLIPAQIAAREILDYATGNVNIVWGRLSSSILNNDLIVEGIEEALSRGIHFSVASQIEKKPSNRYRIAPVFR